MGVRFRAYGVKSSSKIFFCSYLFYSLPTPIRSNLLTKLLMRISGSSDQKVHVNVFAFSPFHSKQIVNLSSMSLHILSK